MRRGRGNVTIHLTADEAVLLRCCVVEMMEPRIIGGSPMLREILHKLNRADGCLCYPDGAVRSGCPVHGLNSVSFSMGEEM